MKLLTVLSVAAALGIGSTTAKADCYSDCYNAYYCPDPCQPLDDAAETAEEYAAAICFSTTPLDPLCEAAEVAAQAVAASAAACEVVNAAGYAGCCLGCWI